MYNIPFYFLYNQNSFHTITDHWFQVTYTKMWLPLNIVIKEMTIWEIYLRGFSSVTNLEKYLNHFNPPP